MSQAISSGKEAAGLYRLPENRSKGLLTSEQVRRGLRDSTIDGMLHAVMTALTSGVFLTAFTLALGASNFQIGLIASLPLLAGIGQLPASYWVERKSRLKGAVVTSSTVSRVFLIFMVLLPLFSFKNNGNILITTLLVLLSLHYIFASISAVGWLSWMSNLVHKELYGRYFGYRNMLIGAITMIATLAGGKVMSLYSHSFGEKNLFGFVVLFFVALIFGFISLRFLKAVPEVEDAAKVNNNDRSIMDYAHPFLDTNFRQLIFFSTLWKFGVNIASPYFTVYMLLDLRLSYGEVAFLSTVNTFASIIGMWMWGKLSDRFGNRPVMKVTGFSISFIPFLWIFTYNLGFPLAILLHLLGGLLWAGYNLTEINILLKLAPKEKNTLYIGTFSALTNLFAAIGSIAGGLSATLVINWKINLYFIVISHLHILFLVSFIIRFTSMRFLRSIREPKEKPLIELIKVLTNPRSMSTALGLHLMFNKSLFKERM